METNQTAKARAMWEALTRAAQSEKIDIITAGFRQSNGDLWKSNKLAHVIINTEAIEISTDMLISSVVYTSSESGMLTSLVLKRKESYTEFVRATVKKKGKKQGIDWGKLINTK
jgi:prophage tail gpP-like protein